MRRGEEVRSVEELRSGMGVMGGADVRSEDKVKTGGEMRSGVEGRRGGGGRNGVEGAENSEGERCLKRGFDGVTNPSPWDPMAGICATSSGTATSHTPNSPTCSPSSKPNRRFETPLRHSTVVTKLTVSPSSLFSTVPPHLLPSSPSIFPSSSSFLDTPSTPQQMTKRAKVLYPRGSWQETDGEEEEEEQHDETAAEEEEVGGDAEKVAQLVNEAPGKVAADAQVLQFNV